MQILAFICEACKNYNLTTKDEHGGAECMSCGAPSGSNSEEFFDFKKPLTAAVLGCGSLQTHRNACWHPHPVDTYDYDSSREPTVVTDLNIPSFNDLRVFHYDLVLMEYLPDLDHLGSAYLLLKPGGILFIMEGCLDDIWLTLETKVAKKGGKDQQNIITVESPRVLYQFKGAVTFGHQGSSCISDKALFFIYNNFFFGQRLFLSAKKCLFFFKKK